MADSDTKYVAIIGCGTIGRQVALVYAQHNRKVTLYDTNKDVAQDALHWIELKLEQNSEQPNLVKTARELKDTVENAWMVIECIAEDINAKKQLFNTLSSLCASNTTITTNSSSIRSSVLVQGIVAASQRRILNAHYFPPEQGPFVELMSCGHTDPDVIEFLSKELRGIGRCPVVCQADSTGFIMNRIWAAVKREIMMVLADGAGNPTDIDAMLKQVMHAKYGPCELMDLVGLQTVCDIEEIYLKERTYLPSYALEFFREKYVESGTG
ncbi:NAD(P)-binding protein, partial [Aspergillus uvarum CBS 121591]